MTIPEPPADLIQLRRDFLTADTRHTKLCQAVPPGQAADEQHAATVREAFNQAAELAAAIAEHPWWTGLNRVEAEPVLRRAAGT